MPTGTREAPFLQVVVGRLAADLSSGGLSATVVTLDGAWPAEYPFFVIVGESTIRAEILKVTNIVGSTFTVERGQLGTSGVAHPANESVSLAVSRGDVARLLARLEQPLGGGGGPSPSSTVVTELDYAQGSSPGVSALYSKGDHTHGSPSLTSSAPAASAVADTSAVGVATTPAKADHRHAREAFGSPGSSAPADVAADGVATTSAKADHRHGRENFGSPGASGVGDTGNDGAATTLAKADHRHQREAFGAVVAETAYGQASANGSAATVPHSDHTHGSPPKQRQEITFTRQGVLSAPIVGALRWYPSVAITIIAVRASVGTAPVGGSVIPDVNKNGTTIFTTQSNRPTIAAGTFTDLADAINVAAVGSGEFLTCDIDAVGPTTPGSDLSVTVSYTVD
jgi:hypothetical protein